MTYLFRFGMHFRKMLVPIRTFHTYPFAAVTACEVCNVLTANKAVAAVVTDTNTFGAVFLTVGADFRTLLAGAAILTHQNTFRTQIAVFAECIGAFKTFFSAALAKGRILNIAFTAGAM